LPEDRADISILIRWENGAESCPWHFWCDEIEIVVPPCCYVCSFERPEGCNLLGKSLDIIFAEDPDGGCPPINKCPLIGGNPAG